MRNSISLYIVYTVSLFLGVSALQGQSTFLFDNREIFDGIDAPVRNADGSFLEGPRYVAELWGGITSDSLSPAVVLFTDQRVIVPFQSGTFAGYFDGGTVTVSVLGTQAWLQVRAWDSHLASTYEEVSALGLGGYGESTAFYATGGDPLSPNPYPPGKLFGLESFSLRPVIPEPSTWALLALGGLALYGFLRPRRAVGAPRKPQEGHTRGNGARPWLWLSEICRKSFCLRFGETAAVNCRQMPTQNVSE